RLIDDRVHTTRLPSRGRYDRPCRHPPYGLSRPHRRHDRHSLRAPSALVERLGMARCFHRRGDRGSRLDHHRSRGFDRAVRKPGSSALAHHRRSHRRHRRPFWRRLHVGPWRLRACTPLAALDRRHPDLHGFDGAHRLRCPSPSRRLLMARILSALIAGLIFGAGIAISGMINPAKVLNFFDFAGTWDPSLAFAMGGALVVTAIGYSFTLKRPAPLFDKTFHLPTARKLDLPLVAGSAVFGIGWGITGFCPGGAVPALGLGHGDAWLFVGSMIGGIALARLARHAMAARTAARTA